MCGMDWGTPAVEMNPVPLPLLSSLGSNNTAITQQISLQMLSLRQRLLYSFLFNIPLRIIICFYRALPRNEDNKTCFYCSSTCGSPSSCWWIRIKADPAKDRTGQKIGVSDAQGDMNKAFCLLSYILFLIKATCVVHLKHPMCRTTVCCGKAPS